MFTFGIFTTHIPYIAFVVFYAYFLIFGVNQASNGTLQIAEKSHTIQMHTDSAVKFIADDCHDFCNALIAEIPGDTVEKARFKQKWKHFGRDKNLSKNLLNNSLFSRPPPALA
jgi:hypothetical protein